MLTDRDIALMSNSRYSIAVLTSPDGTQRNFETSEYESMRQMIRSLSPIKDSKIGTIESPHYTLLYQGGMDPTQINVNISNDQLEFSLGDFVYIGGDAQLFKSLADEEH